MESPEEVLTIQPIQPFNSTQNVDILLTNRSFYPTLDYTSKCNMYPIPFHSKEWENVFDNSTKCFAHKKAKSLPFEPPILSPLEP